ncbi:hypothetical protein ACQ4PT_058595 [Festuca glaucescens]
MAGDGPPLPPSAQPTAPPSLHSASPSNSRAAATPHLSPPLAAPLHGHCPPPPVLTPSASGTSLLPRERITLTPSFEQQTCGELPAAGEVLGDPQPHASGEVHGELPKKICKKAAAQSHAPGSGAVQWSLRCITGRMFRRRRSVAYFAHDPSHRLLLAPDADDDGEFTCDGCQVVGAGPRYLCDHPGCGFKLHEVCSRRFPRSLKSIVHSKHRLKRRESAGGGKAASARCAGRM